MPDGQWKDSTSAIALATTALNTLTAGSVVESSVYTNTENYAFADIEVYVQQFSASIAQFSPVAEVWLVAEVDGSYPDTTSQPQALLFLGVLPKVDLGPVNSAVRLHIYSVPLPPRSFKIVVRNACASASWHTSSNTLKIRPYRFGTA